ncbi:MAG TPA: galactokinase, partial [Candidatus Caenarcaniphilales bacterium]|nr:galactokinase [Candidatus Caenarcaniphilales bacterium]
MTGPAAIARRADLLRRLAELVPGTSLDGAEVRVVRAPGRINLIGEHTDYNLGFVMPAAIGLETWLASVPDASGTVEVTSLQLDEKRSFDLVDAGPAGGDWIDYVAGVAKTLTARGVELRGFRGVLDSDIPIGSGLSSSAALELAAAWSLAREVPPPLAPMELAQAAQQAENEYVGVRCGLMDQFASALGQPGRALLLDCRSLDYRPVKLPAGHLLVVLDSRSPHRLEASAYNARRAQCERAVAALAVDHSGVRSLRDVTKEMFDTLAERVDEETVRRCRHVVEENGRVLAALAALEAGDLPAVGRLFAESHASLRDLYEVSSPELDALVAIATSVPGVVAARMT